MTQAEVEARELSRIARQELSSLPRGIGDIHGAIAGRVFGALGPSAAPVRFVHDTISRSVYSSVSGGLWLGATAAGVAAGRLDGPTTAAAADALGLPPPLAERYLARLKDPAEGLVPDGAVDPAAIRTILDLRRRYRPETDAGTDVFAPALAAGSGLLVAP